VIPERDYVYDGFVLEVHDGDTPKVDIDEGLHDHAHEWIRIKGINAPELSTGKPGAYARDALAGLVLGQHVRLRTYPSKTGEEDRSFVRYVADVWVVADGTFVADWMVAAGYAVRL